MADHDHNHHHSHHHHNHGDDDPSFTERNRAHWDKAAATYNSEQTQKAFGDLINKINAFILKNINWLGVDFLNPASTFEKSEQPQRQVRILDYACGPGTLTNALAGYASEYIGVDLSEKMVEQYNLRFSNQTTETQDTNNDQTINAQAYVGNLLSPQTPATNSEFTSPKFQNFDLAGVSMGFHHFSNLETCTKQLVSRLKSGGIFMIIDFLTHAPNDLGDDFKDALNTVAHHGFTQEAVRELFGRAGLVDVDVVLMEEKVLLKGTAERTGFMARGRKV